MFEKEISLLKSLQRARTTLSSVAARAGVSVSTVSLVLSGKDAERGIQNETRLKVLQAAEELNYAPNLLTRSLRRGRTNVFSFFSSFRHREWGDLYMDRVASAIETAAGDSGYDVLVHCNFSRTTKEICQYLNGGLSDGLIMFAPEPNDPLLTMLRKSPLPVVIMGGLDPLQQFSSVADDVHQGMELVADHLVNAGHRNIAAIGTIHIDVRDSAIRLQLLQATLKARGGTLALDNIIRSGEEPKPILERLMDSSTPPTALFCWHDRLAYLVLEACDALGISVPDQLSIVGYDGLHWPSTSKHICSSVEVDLSAVARSAVSLLDQVITNPSVTHLHQTVPVAFRHGTTLSTVSQK